MEETNTYKAIKKKHVTVFALLLTLATVGIVLFVVTFFNKHKMAANMQGLVDSMYYTLGISLLIGTLSIWYYISKRFLIVVSSQQTSVHIEIKDPELNAPLVISSPFSLKKQWHHVIVGGGRTPKMKRLLVTLINAKDEPVLTFFSDLGAIHEAPMDYEYVDLYTGKTNTKLIQSKTQYGVSKLERMGLTITWALRKLEPKK